MENWEDIQNKDGFYITVNLFGIQPQTADNYGLFFTATRPCEILKIIEVHQAAGSSTPTLDIEKLTGTTSIDNGASVLTTVFSLASTANTFVSKSGLALSANRQLKENDRLALKDSGTLTGIQGLQVTLYFKPLGKGDYR